MSFYDTGGVGSSYVSDDWIFGGLFPLFSCARLCLWYYGGHLGQLHQHDAADNYQVSYAC